MSLPVEAFCNIEGDCWIWRGVVSGGYPRITERGEAQAKSVHRLVWEASFGAIPEGFDIHHTCERKTCINPAHLSAVSRAEHMRLGPQGKPHSHCKNGHELTEDNTYVSGDRRWCRACRRLRQRGYRNGIA